MSDQDREYLVRQFGPPGSNDATFEPVGEWHDPRVETKEGVDLDELEMQTDYLLEELEDEEV